ncbi:TPA: hypothetical protein ACX6SK_000680 [Photobacterium damselae]
MKFNSILIFLFLFSGCVYSRGEINKSNLSNDDLKKINLANIYLEYGKDNKEAIKLTKPYIKNNDNIFARYIYASALARYDLKTSLEMLKTLTNEEYPYAMETYGEKRTCKLNKYKNACLKYGYDKLLSQTYLDWRKIDPSEQYNEFYQQFLDTPWDERINKEHTWFNPKIDKLLRQCANDNVFQCANELQNGLYFINKRTPEQEKDYQYYRKLAKKILINADNLYLKIDYMNRCFDKSKYRDNDICLTKNESYTMLNNLAKKGDLSGYHTLSFLLYKDIYDFSFPRYVLYPKLLSSSKLKDIFDNALKLNNGVGWSYKKKSYNIEPWEKLHNDESLSGFFNKVNKLDSE